MLYWRRVLAVVRGCQALERISAQPGGARKRARLGYTEQSCTSGLYSGSGLRPILRRAKHVGVWLADGDEGRKEKKEVMEAGEKKERKGRKKGTTAERKRKKTKVMKNNRAMGKIREARIGMNMGL